MIWFMASLPHITPLASADLLSITMNRARSKLIKDGDACRLDLGCELHIVGSRCVLRTEKKNNINYYPYRCSLG